MFQGACYYDYINVFIICKYMYAIKFISIVDNHVVLYARVVNNNNNA